MAEAYSNPSSTFIALTDVPNEYSGASEKVVRVKSDETGLEFVAASAAAGAVTGPGSSTDNAVVRFDGAGGTLVQNSGVIIDDTNNITGIASATIDNTGLKVKDTDASHTLAIVPGSNLTANRTLTVTTGDNNRTIDVAGGNLSIAGALTTAGAFTTSGVNSLTLTTTGSTNVTLPTAGTIATLSNKVTDFTAPTSSFSMNSNLITSLAEPVSAQDACTKNYADSVAAGLSLRASCRVATTAPLNTTYNAGAKTLTCNVNGAISVDSISLSANDRVLVKNQTTGQENGVYTVTTVGTAGTPFVLTRATDNDTSAEMISGVYTFIAAGSTWAATGWVLTTADPITLDTTALSFTQFSGATNYVAGNGLTLSGLTFNVGAGTGITVGADTVSVDFSAVQALDATLTALAALNSSAGLLVQTAADTFTKRTIQAGDGIAVSEGAGTTGNPTIAASITTLTADASPDAAADYVMSYDASAVLHKKVLIRDLIAAASTVFRQVGTSPLECWYGPGVTQSTTSTIAMAVAASTSTMYAVPYIEGKGGTLDRMAINVNVAVASTTVRFGIYSSTSNDNLYPNALVVDAGEIDSTTVGTKTQTISASLTKGSLYWFVLIADNSTATLTGPTIRGIAAASMPNILGTSSAFGTTPNTYLSITGQTYGALPNTFPAGATVATGVAPAAIVRYSA